jgi:2-amino-4-hydroxy-6-hydroxymethyldihydropteridine diphosphokinase
MTKIYLSLGSNIQRYQHITAGLNALSVLLSDMQISSIYESKSVGFDGSNFLNLVVAGKTDLTIGELSERLKKIEDDNGRKRSGPKFSPRTLDIDILLYGEFVGVEAGVKLPRDEILQNAFVLLPLVELAGDELHPELKKSFSQLWSDFDKNSQLLWAVNFVWNGKVISFTPTS